MNPKVIRKLISSGMIPPSIIPYLKKQLRPRATKSIFATAVTRKPPGIAPPDDGWKVLPEPTMDDDGIIFIKLNSEHIDGKFLNGLEHDFSFLYSKPSRKIILEMPDRYLNEGFENLIKRFKDSLGQLDLKGRKGKLILYYPTDHGQIRIFEKKGFITCRTISKAKEEALK